MRRVTGKKTRAKQSKKKRKKKKTYAATTLAKCNILHFWFNTVSNKDHTKKLKFKKTTKSHCKNVQVGLEYIYYIYKNKLT